MKKFYICILAMLGLSKMFAFYPEYQHIKYEKIKPFGAYYDFLKPIDKKKVKTIFEVGSRDALDAIHLSDLFQCHVFAFECNPAAIELCIKNIGINPNVTLVPLGVWDKTEQRKFYPVIDGNIGASSFFRFNPKAKNYPDILKDGLEQDEIIVSTIRLDDFLKEQEIENIDLLCMDTQGAAYEVLRSLGDELKNVKYIIVELEVHPIYTGEVLYQQVDAFLSKSGFRRASQGLKKEDLFGDILYINKSLK